MALKKLKINDLKKNEGEKVPIEVMEPMIIQQSKKEKKDEEIIKVEVMKPLMKK